MAQELVVRIVGDASKLEKEFKRAEVATGKFDRGMGRATRGSIAASGAFDRMGRSIAFASGGFLSGVAVTAVVRSSISAAVDLEQQIGKTNVVFGESGKEVEQWSETLAQSFGLAKRQALETAGSFGALFAPVGLTGDVAAEQSKQLTELGADLASFYNTDVQSALDALRSGLVGESEPLRKYGVRLSEVRVQEEALIASGKDNVKQLTELDKTHARIAIILNDSKLAQGDFGRTSETAANQMKSLNAEWENFKTKAAGPTIPVLTALVGEMNDFADSIKNVTSAQEGLPKGPRTNEELFRFLEEQKRLENLPSFPEPFTERGEIDRREAVAARKAADAAKKAAEAAREIAKRVRAAREAARQEAVDRAQLAVDRTQLTDSVSDDIAALNRLNALLRRRIAGSHDTLDIQRDQLEVELQLRGLLKEQREAREQAAKEARDARQFRLLGLGPEGQERVPGVRALQKQLGSLQDLVTGSFLDTKKTRSILAGVRAALRDGLRGMSEDVRRRIQEILADLRSQLKQSSVDVTRFQHSARGQLTLAGAHPGGGTTIHTVNVYGVQDVPGMERELQKRKKQRARQRRSTR